MILHLLFHDKFEDYAIKQFSLPEMCSELIVIHSSPVFCHSPSYPNTRFIYENSSDFDQLLLHLDQFKAIVFHGLFSPWQEKVLRCVPQFVKVAWVFWGGDIYCRKELREKYLSRLSKLLLQVYNIKRIIKRQPIEERYEIPFELLKRIDYCLSDIDEDYFFVKNYFKTNIECLWYNYYSIEETIGELSELKCSGNNVLLGNSSSIECNHLDGLLSIKKLGLLPSSSKIYVPLNYGDAWLKRCVSFVGRLLFGSRFMVISKFLPRNQYNDIIRSCSIAIMPHYRPQAFGNILTALWLGTRVYISKKNNLYGFFKRIGVFVFSIEDDLLSKRNSTLAPLSDDEIRVNRLILSSIYGSERMYLRNVELVNKLNL